MNTTIDQIHEYIGAESPEIETLYYVVSQSDEYRDYLLKQMIDSLNPETEPLEKLNDIHELMGFINGFRLAWHLRKQQKDDTAEAPIQMIREEQPA